MPRGRRTHRRRTTEKGQAGDSYERLYAWLSKDVIPRLGGFVLMAVGILLVIAAIWAIWVPEEELKARPPTTQEETGAAADTTPAPPPGVATAPAATTTTPAATTTAPADTNQPDGDEAPADDENEGEAAPAEGVGRPGEVSRRSTVVTVAALFLGTLLLVLGGFYSRVEEVSASGAGFKWVVKLRAGEQLRALIEHKAPDLTDAEKNEVFQRSLRRLVQQLPAGAVVAPDDEDVAAYFLTRPKEQAAREPAFALGAETAPILDVPVELLRSIVDASIEEVRPEWQ